MKNWDIGKLVFIDSEFANNQNDSICEIAMVVWENGREVLRTSELIDPQASFDNHNIEIHGIWPEDVKGCRILPEFYEEYKQYFTGEYIIAGHNINSDLVEMRNHLARYDIQLPSFYIVDTQDLVRNEVYHNKTSRGSMSLSCICKNMGISLNAHYALDDCLACTKIVSALMQNEDFDLNQYVLMPDLEREKKYKQDVLYWQSLPIGTILKDIQFGEVTLVSRNDEYLTVDRNGIQIQYRFPWCFTDKKLVVPDSSS